MYTYIQANSVEAHSKEAGWERSVVSSYDIEYKERDTIYESRFLSRNTRTSIPLRHSFSSRPDFLFATLSPRALDSRRSPPASSNAVQSPRPPGLNQQLLLLLLRLSVGVSVCTSNKDFALFLSFFLSLSLFDDSKRSPLSRLHLTLPLSSSRKPLPFFFFTSLDFCSQKYSVVPSLSPKNHRRLGNFLSDKKIINPPFYFPTSRG